MVTGREAWAEVQRMKQLRHPSPGIVVTDVSRFKWRIMLDICRSWLLACQVCQVSLRSPSTIYCLQPSSSANFTPAAWPWQPCFLHYLQALVCMELLSIWTCRTDTIDSLITPAAHSHAPVCFSVVFHCEINNSYFQTKTAVYAFIVHIPLNLPPKCLVELILNASRFQTNTFKASLLLKFSWLSAA